MGQEEDVTAEYGQRLILNEHRSMAVCDEIIKTMCMEVDINVCSTTRMCT